MSKELILKPIYELLGESFHIPYYQRGYRWTKQQVEDLLNDIWTFANTKKSHSDNEFYCLQPVVVKEKHWVCDGGPITGWEVIDGQQRLTTIYIIISYIARDILKVDSLREEYGQELYTIQYETRPDSENFIKNIKDDRSNIDFYYMAEAYRTVKEWFTNGATVKDRTDREIFLSTILGRRDHKLSVQVIWYEVDKDEDSQELFTRLNMGKIPLTNAELIKALFLSSSSFTEDIKEEKTKKKFEISLVWDDIEQKLTDEHFWAFATNHPHSKYSSKIELIFDMMANKPEKSTDPLYTFLYFLNETKKPNRKLWDLWLLIERYYHTLLEWYKDKNLYHKIGYLVSIGHNLRDLIDRSSDIRKDEFENKLDKLIRGSINFDIKALNYENNADVKKIEKVLLLFNIESIRKNPSIQEYYPFKFYKSTSWSLEHIHAQNSEGMDRTKKDPWIKWLAYHKNLMMEMMKEIKANKRNQFSKIIAEIDQLDNEKITWDKFNALSEVIIEQFSANESEERENMHSISNLALLSQPDNAALNNSVFEVKRREIIKMDKEGRYIPICTRRVFLKYYNPQTTADQYYFWSQTDRKNYFDEIMNVIRDYLPEESSLEVQNGQ